MNTVILHEHSNTCMNIIWNWWKIKAAHWNITQFEFLIWTPICCHVDQLMLTKWQRLSPQTLITRYEQTSLANTYKIGNLPSKGFKWDRYAWSKGFAHMYAGDSQQRPMTATLPSLRGITWLFIVRWRIVRAAFARWRCYVKLAWYEHCRVRTMLRASRGKFTENCTVKVWTVVAIRAMQDKLHHVWCWWCWSLEQVHLVQADPGVTDLSQHAATDLLYICR